MEYRKVYVEMTVRVSTEGKLTPVALHWQDRLTYTVDAVLDRSFCPPSHVGGALTDRFECRFGQNVRALYRERMTGRWFVECFL